MCFSLCKRPITLDIVLPILVKWNLKLRLLSSVRLGKLKSCIYSKGDPFKSKFTSENVAHFDKGRNRYFYN